MSKNKQQTNNNASSLGTLIITMNIEGSVVDKGIKFVPTMISPEIKNNNIYFPMTVPLTNNTIKKAVPNVKLIDILTRLSNFSQFMYYSTDPIRYKPLVLGSDNVNKIIENNIQFIINNFFKKYIQINGRSYSILSNTINKTSYPKKKGVPLIAKVDVTLTLIDRKNDNIEGRTRYSCINKRKAINETVNSLFGAPLFERRQNELYTKNIDERLPPMYSSVATGTTTGKAPGKVNKIMTYPYGYGYYPGTYPTNYKSSINKSQRSPMPYAPFPYAPIPYAPIPYDPMQYAHTRPKPQTSSSIYNTTKQSRNGGYKKKYNNNNKLTRKYGARRVGTRKRVSKVYN